MCPLSPLWSSLQRHSLSFSRYVHDGLHEAEEHVDGDGHDAKDTAAYGGQQRPVEVHTHAHIPSDAGDAVV